MGIEMYVDLEETVIESFTDPRLVKQKAVQQVLHHFSIQRAIIFSFAIWNSADKALYHRGISESLQSFYRVNMNETLLMTDVNAAYRTRTSIYLEDEEFMLLHGKQGAFIEHVRNVSDPEKYEIFVLLDDTVENTTIKMRDINSVIHFINVDTFQERGLPYLGQ